MTTTRRRIILAAASILAATSLLLLHPAVRAQAESALRRVGVYADENALQRVGSPLVLINTRGNDRFLIMQTSGAVQVEPHQVTAAEAMLARRVSITYFGDLPMSAPPSLKYAGVRIQTVGTSYSGTYAGFYYTNEGFKTVDFELNPPVALEPGVMIVPEGAPNVSGSPLLVMFTGSALGTRGDGVEVR
jgi:hypothetical protein